MTVPSNPEDYRQCIACSYICSDERVWNEDPPWRCPSCKKIGCWSSEVDWSTPRKVLEKLAQMAQELDLE